MKPFCSALAARTLFTSVAALAMAVPLTSEAIELIPAATPAPSGGMVIIDINHTVSTDGTPTTYTIPVPRGEIAITVGISTDGSAKEYAFASSGGSVVFSLDAALAPTDAVAPNVAPSFLAMFGPGDIVDELDFLNYSFRGNFYDPYGGEWAHIGDTGFFGWRSGSPGEYTYGWLEATRGSLTAGQLGYNLTDNAGAPIPAPAPPTLPLLLSGAVCLVRLRRRACG
jgi:hypothetical protein